MATRKANRRRRSVHKKRRQRGGGGLLGYPSFPEVLQVQYQQRSANPLAQYQQRSANPQAAHNPYEQYAHRGPPPPVVYPLSQYGQVPPQTYRPVQQQQQYPQQQQQQQQQQRPLPAKGRTEGMECTRAFYGGPDNCASGLYCNHKNGQYTCTPKTGMLSTIGAFAAGAAIRSRY
jgi:hypothetical protein